MEALEYRVNSEGKLEAIHYTDSRLLGKQKLLVKGTGVGDTIDRLVDKGRKSGRGIKKLYTTNNEKDFILKYSGGVVKIDDFKNTMSRNEFTDLKRQIKHKLENEKVAKKFNKLSNANTKEPKVFRKKVRRLNKFAKKVVITATGFALFGIAAVGFNDPSSLKQNIVENDKAPEIVEKVDKVETSTTEDIKIEKNEADEFVVTYNDRTETGKLDNVEAKYGAMIEKYSERYGLDANLMKALATQESGEHVKGVNEGGAVGLMQIQYGVWNGSTISATNVLTGERESVKINLETLNNTEKNIQIGCMIYQSELVASNYNIALATQTYNMGRGNMSKIMSYYQKDTGKTYEDVKNDPTNNEWLKYRQYLVNDRGGMIGDHNYLEHVLSYVEDDDNILHFKDAKGNDIQVEFVNPNQASKAR